MSDLTPPPDRPLGDQSRARIREELLRAAREDAPGRAHRWMAPVVAAAAVVLVAGLTAWAVQSGEGDEDGAPAAPGTTATSSTTPSPTPSDLPTPDPTSDDQVQQVGRGSCVDELVNVLPGAEQVVAFDDHTSIWVDADRFVLCDVRDGVTTVHRPVSMSAPRGVVPFRVSTVYTPEKGGLRVTRVAGGLVAAGAEEVFTLRYVFADGHVEPATTITDDDGRTWWRMVYSTDSDAGNETKQPPITATLSLSGVQKTYPLDWATDTCAQANHGC